MTQLGTLRKSLLNHHSNHTYIFEFYKIIKQKYSHFQMMPKYDEYLFIDNNDESRK